MKVLDLSYTFTRPANTTAYTSGNLVANSTTNTSVVPLSWNLGYGQYFKIFQATIQANSSANTNAQFNLNLYAASPTVTNGDGGAWLSTSSLYQGSIPISCSTVAFSDNLRGVGIFTSSSLWAPMYIVSDQNYKIYGLLSATAAYTPTSAEIFTVNIRGECYQ